MKLYLVNHDQRYAAEQMLLTLFPEERPEYPHAPTDGDCAVLTLSRGAQNATVTCRLRRDGKTALGRAAVPIAALTDDQTEGRLISRAVKRAFYHAALQLGVKKPVWGALTGVRPGKLMEKLLLEGCTDAQAYIAALDPKSAARRLFAYGGRFAASVMNTVYPPSETV